MIKHSLVKEVDKLLQQQAKINEKSIVLIDRFLEENEKQEINSFVDLIHNVGAPKHIQEIEEFKIHYIQNSLEIKDIKTYLNLLKIHKGKMKYKNDVIGEIGNE